MNDMMIPPFVKLTEGGKRKKFTKEDLRKLKALCQFLFLEKSANSQLYEDSTEEILDNVACWKQNPEMEAKQNILESFICEQLKELNNKERKIIHMLYMMDMTLKEVGAVFGIQHQAVSLIEKRALEKLRRSLSWKGVHKISDAI